MNPQERIPRFVSNRCVAVHVCDLQQAKAFYSDVLGLSLKQQTDECLVYNSGALELYVVRDDDARPPVPSFTVSDLDAARRHLEEHGCHVVRANNDSLYFEEPSGTVFDLIEQREDAP